MKKTFIKIEDLFKVGNYATLRAATKNDENRQIKQSHVNDFVNVCKEWNGEGPVYGLSPIIINPITGHILDGQHKDAAYRESVENGILPEDAPVLIGYWSIPTDKETSVIIALNTHSKNWTLDDYVESFAKSNDSYSRLVAFANGHELCHKGNKIESRYAAAIIKGTSCQKFLREKTFTVTDEEINLGNTVHDELLEIRNKLGITRDYTIEPMAIEWHKYRNDINLKGFLKATYVPVVIRNSEKKNQSNWRQIFINMKENWPVAA